jgi:hypothetical protein
MPNFEYMRIPCTAIPDELMEHYNLHNLVHNGAVYVEIQRGMYGLPQAGKLANDQLLSFLAPHGYRPCKITPGLWKHDTRPIQFTLVVDDFGVKYTDEADAKHLLSVLEQHYKCSVDWTGTRYCGLTVAWDYKARTCDISLPGYIERLLKRFAHIAPNNKRENSPHAWVAPSYGQKVQYSKEPDESPPLDADGMQRVREVVGALLFYARAVDSSILKALGTIASQQAKSTKATMQAVTKLLNYCASNPDTTIRYIASDMILTIDSDASYLSESKSRSTAGGYHYLSNKPSTAHPKPPLNGAILVLCQILKEVVASASEAELAALFHNCREACPLRTTLEELGHPQPATPVKTDNSTAAGISNDTVKQKRSKAIDMRFYWVRDRVGQGQFNVFWASGKDNDGDYYTKHFPGSYHQEVRPKYFYEPTSQGNYYSCLALEVPPTGLV